MSLKATEMTFRLVDGKWSSSYPSFPALPTREMPASATRYRASTTSLVFVNPRAMLIIDPLNSSCVFLLLCLSVMASSTYTSLTAFAFPFLSYLTLKSAAALATPYLLPLIALATKVLWPPSSAISE